MLIWKLAWRNLFRNTRRTVLTSVLITSALIVIILADGLIAGMVDTMVGSITHTLEGEAQVNRKGFRDNYEVDYTIDNPDDIITKIEADSAVAGYGPRVIIGGMVASPYNTTGGLVYGVDAESELAVSKIKDAVYEGSYLTGAPRELLMGSEMVDLLEVKLGDRIIITAAAVDSNEIKQELFRVSGFVHFGPDEMDKSFVFINLDQAQKVLGMEGKLHQIAIRFADANDANQPLPIYDAVRSDDIEAEGWLALQPSLGAMIGMTNYASAIVGLILFILTSLGVVNSMFMSIYERIYEFGVAKAIGTTPAQVIQLVLMEAFLLAVISCVFGVIIGYALSDYFATNGLPIGGEMQVSGVAIAGSIYPKLMAYQFYTFPIYVALLTIVAAIYPAIFASRIVPTRALQRAL